MSYAREDQVFVRWLHEQLSEQGRDVWVDWEGLPPSAEWLSEVFQAIEEADTFLFVVSPDSLQSQVCAQELEHAGAFNKRIVPVVCHEPGGVPVPELVGSAQLDLLSLAGGARPPSR